MQKEERRGKIYDTSLEAFRLLDNNWIASEKAIEEVFSLVKKHFENKKRFMESGNNSLPTY